MEQTAATRPVAKRPRREDVQQEQQEQEEHNEADTDKRAVVLFYKYVNLGDGVAAEILRQESKCAELGLSGRMRVAPEGINGTLFGSMSALAAYEAFMENTKEFPGIQYKYSGAGAEGKDPFEGALVVQKTSEVTSTGPMRDAKPTALGGRGGTHLSPDDFHELLRRAEKDKDIVVLDTRNHYETAVGTFRQAVDPKLRCFAQFPSWIEANQDLLKGKHVAMFCTGGVRCEKASAWVRNLGVASEVSQLAGGIHSYLERFSPAAKASGVATRVPAANANGEDAPSRDPTAVSTTAAEIVASGAGEEAPVGGDEEKGANAAKDSECFFEGINFQFDKRFSQSVVGEGSGISSIPRAVCLSCATPWSETREGVQCFVCKDFVLLCDDCVSKMSLTPLDGFSGERPENAILCAEHQFLADDWRSRVARLDLSDETIAQHIVALERLLRASSRKRQQRGQAKRKARLRLQIERLETLAKERGSACEALLTTLRARDQRGEAGFAPFVPMFAWRPRVATLE
ncbi:Thiosulfate sulfurtransferase/rhodanese-like domain-containing protein 2 [Hondaea fermentalgiana]|uniref:Thiosulfate sulfurtransferase/rhodanese-like domain-containing protein 2 n=1 Tax=Hondaea fermentalgiana TaxID=2315210 RepID=A0A2R5G9K4_9STRA|nr:Thiosulfate sulfurtransferase/rhodanese-like domain-containing protein 2 [Hondaea fermentalgiana]|eukprot:GBG25183.1 Thiosulfate sulfurtransferase/rhodanese-like domain-containing protein 2 [Hondaea fermentalgiana]